MSLDLYIFPQHAKERLENKGVDLNDPAQILPYLNPETDSRDLVSALTLIRGHEFPQALEPAKSLIFHQVPQVRSGALATVAAILKQDGSEYYAEVMGHPQFREKSAAAMIVRKYGNEICVPPMVKRLRQMISTRRGTPYLTNTGESDLTFCIDFLSRFAGRGDVQGSFRRLVQKWEMLHQQEADWITSHVAFFDHSDLKRSEAEPSDGDKPAN